MAYICWVPSIAPNTRSVKASASLSSSTLVRRHDDGCCKRLHSGCRQDLGNNGCESGSSVVRILSVVGVIKEAHAATGHDRAARGRDIRRSPWHRAGGGAAGFQRILPVRPLPKHQRRSGSGSTDAWITLAGLARETSTIRLGTMVSSATFRLPGPLAIAVATVDAMSGRVEAWSRHGLVRCGARVVRHPVPPIGERFDLLEEQLTVITGLWTTPPGERFSFAGEHVTVRDSPALPKPVQHPRPRSSSAARDRGARRVSRPASPTSSTWHSRRSMTRRPRSHECARRAGHRARSGHDGVRRRADARRGARRGRGTARSGDRPQRDQLRRDQLGGTVEEVVDKIGRFAR